MRSVLRQRADRGAVDTFTHRFSACFDLVTGGVRAASLCDGVTRNLHSVRLLVDRMFDVARSYATRGEFECAIFERSSGKLVRAGSSDAIENALRDIRRQHFSQSRGGIVSRSLRSHAARE
jgi:hypothetical protein